MSKPEAMSIFLEAVENHHPEGWHAFLDSACGSDTALRSDIEKLLAGHRALGTFHDDVQPIAAAETATLDHPGPSLLGTQIGPYKLREQIGEGGMGVVYVAEQSAPVKRKVALKVIRPGMASKDVVARFEAERQALAMMDHPNIARVFDGGTTAQGHPYFVMELVRGVPITDYCEQHQLDLSARLRLFSLVCKAVQHAHQKGIIHRDLKPSNIILAEIDDAPVPKVIDFGVAKALNQTLSQETVYTQFSQIVGTPLYMSPEQTGLGVIDIDTRSDVYSLGVLLYELLTGQTPFDSETLKQVGFDEMRRIIREDEPLKPSAMVSTLKAEALSTISQCRGSDPRKLSESLSGELDWLVMKALEKDRNRRYESASALADDVERFLNQEPIAAGPPSAAYRVKKYAQRNKGRLIATALAAAVLLIGGGIAVNAQVQQARQQRAIEQDVELSLAEARTAIETGDLAVAQQLVSEAAGRITNAREQLHDLAGRVNALSAEVSQRREQVKQFELFEQLARDGMDSSFSGSHDEEGLVRKALGTYDILEDDHWWERVQSSYLPKKQQQRLRQTAYEALLVLADSGVRWRRSEKSAKESLAMLRKGSNFHDPTRAFYWVRSECLDILGNDEHAEDDRQRYESTPAILAFDYFLPGHTAGWRGDLDEAIRSYEAALQLEPNHFNSLFFLAFRSSEHEKDDQAIAYFRACLAVRPKHVPTLRNLALALAHRGEYAQAWEYASKATKLSPTTAQFCAQGQILVLKGEYHKALKELNQAVELVKSDTDPKLIEATHVYRGYVYNKTGRSSEAIEEYSKAIELKGNDLAYEAYEARAKQYQDLNNFPAALADIESAITHFTHFGKSQRHKARLHSNRGVINRKLKNYEQALQDQLRAIDIDPSFDGAYVNAALLLLYFPDPTNQDPAKALQLLNEAIKLDPKSSSELSLLGLAQYRTGDFLEAINSCTQAIDNDGDYVDVFAMLTRSMAQAQLGHKEEAIKSYENAKQRIDAEKQLSSEEFIEAALERLLAEAEQLLDKQSEQSMRASDVKQPKQLEPDD